MTDVQQLKFSADDRAEKFCQDHNADLVALVEYALEKAAFDGDMVDLRKAIVNQGLDIIPIASDKKMDKLTMAEVVIKYALRGSVKAHQLGNLELELGLSHPLTYISGAEDQTAITRAGEMKKLMADNIGILTNLTSGNITEMGNDISAFTLEKNRPKQAIGVKKSTGTDLINPVLDEVDVSRDNIGKLVHSYLPLLAAEWDQVTHIGDVTSVRHLRMIVIYKDFETGVTLGKVKGSLSNGVDAPIIRYSTKKGSLREKGVANGNYTLTSVLAGYVTDVHTAIGIEDGKIIKLEIKLKKA